MQQLNMVNRPLIEGKNRLPYTAISSESDP